jgi:uncharacterized membrane protein YphA (DoxX/SURF4 family)
MRYIAPIFSFLSLGLVGLLSFFTGARSASAHVAYVVSQDSLVCAKGTDFHFLLSPFGQVNYLVMMVCVCLMIGAIYYLAHHIPLAVDELAFVKRRLMSYQDLVPWILRLGLGILFMGAALHNTFISPITPDIGHLAGYELILGFLLLLGFMVTPVLLVMIAFYFISLLQNGYAFGGMEVLGSAIALLLLANSRPGFDDIVGIPTLLRNKLSKYVPLILRITLGGSFIFLAFYEKLFNPHFFEVVVTKYHLTTVVPVSPAMWVLAVGLIELMVGIFILFGFKTRITAAIAFFVVTSTFFFFKEDVYSHVSIFAVLSALFITGGGHWSIDEHLEYSRSKNGSGVRKPARSLRIASKTITRTSKKTVVRKRITRKKTVKAA